jgi:hypothetical protein
MDSALPFRPQGVGGLIAVKPAPTAGFQPSGPNSGDVCYLVYNPASQVDAFIGYGPTSASAVANAAVPLVLSSPVVATGQGGGMFVAPTGTLQVLALSPNLFFAGAGLSSCSVWIQPGFGV